MMVLDCVHASFVLWNMIRRHNIPMKMCRICPSLCSVVVVELQCRTPGALSPNCYKYQILNIQCKTKASAVQHQNINAIALHLLPIITRVFAILLQMACCHACPIHSPYHPDEPRRILKRHLRGRPAMATTGLFLNGCIKQPTDRISQAPRAKYPIIVSHVLWPFL